jgi:uncharacterized membrane protein YbhN (UPF0104 family)
VTAPDETDPAPARVRSSPRVKRALQAIVSLVVVGGIFIYAIPKIADYSAVWATIADLSPLELASIVGAMLFNLVTYWLANMAALPGLTPAKAAVLTQTTTSVANTLPAGGAVAVGLTYSILRSWGFDPHAITLYVGVTGIWNLFLKLGLPIVALALLAVSGEASAALLAAALIGLAVLAAALLLFGLALWKKEFARGIGDRAGRVVSAVRRLVHRPPITTWGDQAAAFRGKTITLVARRWLPLTLATVLSHLALWFVLYLSLRHVGIAEGEISTLQILAVFSFGRLLTAIPITPGGLGVIELGYIGGLVAADGNEAQVVAAVLLFRLLTYGVQIPLGGVTYLVWRTRSRWRQARTAESIAAR